MKCVSRISSWDCGVSAICYLRRSSTVTAVPSTPAWIAKAAAFWRFHSKGFESRDRPVRCPAIRGVRSVHRRCSSGSPRLVPKGLSRPGEHLAPATPSPSGSDVVLAYAARNGDARVHVSTLPLSASSSSSYGRELQREDGRPDPQGHRLIPMLLPSVYRIGSSSVSTRN